VRVLIVGSGGREHALAWKLSQSPGLSRLYAAPGNSGIARLAECVPIKADAISELVMFAEREQVDLTVVGPELPLTLGIADLLRARGLACFGPDRGAARVESSKAFAKALMSRHGIPTARARSFTDPTDAAGYARAVAAPLVVKADGLAAGKGVTVCRDLPSALEAIEQIMVKKVFGVAGETVVIEECLQGEEASFFALTDGAEVVPLEAVQDHKAVFDGDQGPNTGGMGAYSPPPSVSDRLAHEITERVMIPTVRALAEAGHPYRGLLYAGLMLTAGGPKVLEFNARFGDPETQPLLLRLEDDLLPVLHAAATGDALPKSLRFGLKAAVCVVLASGGYPGEYVTGKPITGIEAAEALADVVVFHAGTTKSDGHLVTAGGRVLGVTALGGSVGAAIERAYEAVSKIHFDGMHYRRDIGRKALRV
jgi:phosphoribosylamine--glycine ligase